MKWRRTSPLCDRNFSQQIPIHYNTELSTLAANINHLRDTIRLLMRLIDNICPNIFKHGASEKIVTLTVSMEEGYLVLEESSAILRKTVKIAAANSGYGLAICGDVLNTLGGGISHRTADVRFSVTLRFLTPPEQNI